MTNGTLEPQTHDAAPDGSPSARGLGAPWSIRSAGVAAGVAILGMSVFSAIGIFAAVEGLVTPGDAAKTAEDILASVGLFRLGIVSLFLVIALDVVAAWGLYRVFSPVSKSISLLAAWFRLAYASVFLVAITQLVGSLRMLGDDDSLTAFSVDQRHAQALAGIEAFHDIWSAGLFLFGLHLAILGYLAYRSGYVPRFLGVLLVIAGLGYVVDTVGGVLTGGSWTDVGTVTFLGEFLLALWLVIRGRRLTSSASPSS